MAAYLSLHYHIVFATKGRVPVLDKAWRQELHGYMGGTLKGLGAFTVGWREREIVRRYIDGQEEHHGRRAYSEEVVDLLNEAGIEFDPKYLG